MANTDVKDLLNAGVHFGHLTRKWNPNMAPFIYMERNGIHIINLYKTAAKVDEAAEAMKKLYRRSRVQQAFWLASMLPHYLAKHARDATKRTASA